MNNGNVQNMDTVANEKQSSMALTYSMWIISSATRESQEYQRHSITSRV
jgi:hypothetical protein